MANRQPARHVHPALLALENAPLDDEPVSAELARDLDAAHEEIRRGDVVAHETVRRLWLKKP